jgi:hypothetical protein
MNQGHLCRRPAKGDFPVHAYVIDLRDKVIPAR